jgi:hypothetical protein
MNYLGDFAEDSKVYIYFTTHDKEGGTVAPSSAFEVDDFHVYKDGNSSEKSSTNGMSISSLFTGLHLLIIDTAIDTGDAGFWATGGEYAVVLDPDETVDGEAVVKVVGAFSIERTGSALALASSIDSKVDVIDGIVDAILVDTGTTLDTKINTIVADVAAILVDTSTTLDGKIDAIDTIVDAVLIDTSVTIPALIAALPSVAAILDESVEGAITLRQAMRVLLAYLAGRANGGGTAIINFRDQANTKNRISMSVDSSGNRSAVTLDVS